MTPYPAYRETRSIWLSHIPVHWEDERAKHYFLEIDHRSQSGTEELLSVSHISGVTPRSEKDVTMFMAESYVGHKLCQPGDLVINSMWAWMGAAGISAYHGIVSPAYGVYRLKQRDLFEPKYLDYLLRTKGYAGEYLCRSNGIWTSRLLLTPSDFFDVPILRPPRDEQDAIVAFLDRKLAEIDRFIAAKERLIALLREQKAAIINRAVTRGLDPDAPTKPSGIAWLGEIPAHWTLTKLSRVCLSVRDGTHAPPPAVPGVHRLLSARNIVSGAFVIRDDDRTMAPEDFAVLEKSYTLRQGDVVMAIVGATTGKSAVVGEMVNVSVQRSIAILRPNSRRILSAYLNYWLMSAYVQNLIHMIMEKYAAQPGIYLEDVAALRIPSLSLDEQRAIVEQIAAESAALDAAISTAERQIALMRELRTALIAGAVTGKIDVRSAVSAVVEEVPV